MRILIATRDYFPARGGLQASTDTLVRGLMSNGHTCAVLVHTYGDMLKKPTALAMRAARKLFHIPIVIQDRSFPYSAYRTPHPRECLSAVRRRFRPDVLVCVVGGSHSIQFARDLLAHSDDLPSMIYVFDIEGVAILSDPLSAKTHVITNAEAISDLARAHRDRPPVVPCIVDPGDSKVKSSRKVALYINPHPRKGEDLAWAMAESAPDIPFVFQESWKIKDEKRRAMIERAGKLGNVEFRPVTDSPARVYADARILLAPYESERPRVIEEALANGIPVIASNVPGLDECVGTGGILVDPKADISRWTSALEPFFSDDTYYREMITAAVRQSKRKEVQPEYLVQLFEHELRNTLKK